MANAFLVTFPSAQGVGPLAVYTVVSVHFSSPSSMVFDQCLKIA